MSGWDVAAEKGFITERQAVLANSASAKLAKDGDLESYERLLVAIGVAENPDYDAINAELLAAADADRGIG